MAQINRNSVCLVSGGGRGITAQAAIAIARQYQCKFILLGRSAITPEPSWAQNCDSEMELKKRILEHLLQQDEKPTPKMVQQEYKSIAATREIEQTLHQIKEVGGVAEYISVDVTDANAVSQQVSTVEKKLGSVNAIVHGAGNLADKPIEKKTELDFDIVYTPKVKGLESLLNCIDPSGLDCLVLFSSVVGFYGNAGQTDYAIANDILNKTAHLMKQKYPQCHTVAIDWGPWDSGMVSPELKKAFAERDIKTIPIDAGTQMLVEELAPDNKEVQVVIGSPLKPPAIVATESKTKRIQRHLSKIANPFLNDHVIMDRPVLPATCAIAWIGNLCEQICPGYTFLSCNNFKVLKGIVFDENLADKYIVDLEQIPSENPKNIEFNAKIWSEDRAGKIRYHFSDRTVLVPKLDNFPQYELLNLEREITKFTGQKIYQNGDKSLFHGTSFQGVKQVLNVSEDRLTMECYLPALSPKTQGQFPVQTFNPYIVDVQVHSFWLWLQHNYQEICLPSEIVSYEQFIFIPLNQTFYVSCEIKSKTKTAVVADVIAHDENGKIYSRMTKAKGTIIFF